MKQKNYTTEELIDLIEKNNSALKFLYNKLAREKKLAEGQAEDSKDFSRWLLDNKWYNKVNFTHAVCKNFIDGKMSIAQIKKLLKDTIDGFDIFIDAERYNDPDTDKIRYHSEPIKTTDGAVLHLSNQWGRGNWFDFLKVTHWKFGFPLVCRNLSVSGRKEFDKAEIGSPLYERNEQ